MENHLFFTIVFVAIFSFHVHFYFHEEHFGHFMKQFLERFFETSKTSLMEIANMMLFSLTVENYKELEAVLMEVSWPGWTGWLA